MGYESIHIDYIVYIENDISLVIVDIGRYKLY